MANFECPGCKHLVDETIKLCPNCDYNIRKYVKELQKQAKKTGEKVFTGIALSSVYDSGDEDGMAPQLDFLKKPKTEAVNETVAEQPVVNLQPVQNNIEQASYASQVTPVPAGYEPAPMPAAPQPAPFGSAVTPQPISVGSGPVTPVPFGYEPAPIPAAPQPAPFGSAVTPVSVPEFKPADEPAMVVTPEPIKPAEPVPELIPVAAPVSSSDVKEEIKTEIKTDNNYSSTSQGPVLDFLNKPEKVETVKAVAGARPFRTMPAPKEELKPYDPNYKKSSPAPEAVVAEPVAAPVVEPVAAPVVEPVAAPVVEPVAAPVVEPVAAPVVEPVAAPVIEPVAAPVIEPVAAPVIEPVAAPVIEPVAAPVVEPVATPVAEPKPLEDPAPDPVVTPVSQPAGLNPMAPTPSPAGLNPMAPTPSPVGLNPMAPTPSPAGLNPMAPAPQPAGLNPMAPTPSPVGLNPMAPTPSPVGLNPMAPTPSPVGLNPMAPTPSPVGANPAFATPVPKPYNPAQAANPMLVGGGMQIATPTPKPYTPVPGSPALAGNPMLAGATPVPKTFGPKAPAPKPVKEKEKYSLNGPLNKEVEEEKKEENESIFDSPFLRQREKQLEEGTAPPLESALKAREMANNPGYTAAVGSQAARMGSRGPVQPGVNFAPNIPKPTSQYANVARTAPALYSDDDAAEDEDKIFDSPLLNAMAKRVANGEPAEIPEEQRPGFGAPQQAYGGGPRASAGYAFNPVAARAAQGYQQQGVQAPNYQPQQPQQPYTPQQSMVGSPYAANQQATAGGANPMLSGGMARPQSFDPVLSGGVVTPQGAPNGYPPQQ